LLLSQAQALYFYIDGPTQKCFFEDLPKDTMVVGKDRTDRIGRCKI
jgi:p24 family protein alpha